MRQSSYIPSNLEILVPQQSPDDKLCVWKRSPFHPKLMECYCHSCGLLIGASANADVLRVLSRIHVCPVYFKYSKPAA